MQYSINLNNNSGRVLELLLFLVDAQDVLFFIMNNVKFLQRIYIYVCVCVCALKKHYGSKMRTSSAVKILFFDIEEESLI